MKQILAIQPGPWQQARIVVALREPWTGSACENILDSFQITNVEELRGTWFGEYHYAIYAEGPEPSGSPQLVYLSTYNPRQ